MGVPCAPAKKRAKADSDEEDDGVNSETLEGLSGDDIIDTSNIIAGGRRARRGRPTSFAAAIAKYAATNPDDDSDED